MAMMKPKNNEGRQLTPMAAIREGAVFPHVEIVLTFGRPKSVKAVDASFGNDRQIVLVSQKKSKVLDPSADDLYQVGVLAQVERTLKTNDEINALVKGVRRVKIESVIDNGDFLAVEHTPLQEINTDSAEVDALSRQLLSEFKKAVNFGKGVEFLNFMKLVSGVGAPELADQIAATLGIETQKKQKILEALDVKKRLELVLQSLTHEVKVLEIEKGIVTKTQKKFDKNMRETVLRERIRTIQKELGEDTDEDQEVAEFRKKIAKVRFPKKTKKKVLKDLDRFARLSMHSPEYSYIRSWLETILEMPWNKRSKNNVSLAKAEKVLDTEHYGLSDVKERIIEYLSVLQLKKRQKSKNQRNVPTIICFAGPPGVGKTSIGRSIAHALGREFVKMSLGGIRDEAEIRGHRRTYVGAMPGRIIQGIRTAGTKNPVFMLDEIDKVGNDFRGDPSAALLEALDPEQNSEFSDHYLDVPFDLSEIIFITTANVLDTIPPALRDRLEIIRFSGYTEDEKYEIARQHLVEKTLRASGLNKRRLSISAQALRSIIKNYTREAGVRSLERQISKVMRKAAKKIAGGEVKKVSVGVGNLVDYLGPEQYTNTLAESKHEIGLATGLAWTQVGGDILFIEVALMPGKGNIVLTGKLGDVMQESAKAAWSYVRSKWKELGLKKDFYKNMDVHIHVPEGAVPKDGPSAGITISTALVSALTKKHVRHLVGMTGEVTLRGRVLQIGGVKEKVIAGHRAGLKQIIMPEQNKKDMVKIPESVKKDMKFHFVDHMDQVLKLAVRK